VIVSSKGYVLTNQHVIQGGDEVWVVLEDCRKQAGKRRVRPTSVEASWDLWRFRSLAGQKEDRDYRAAG